MTKPPFQITTAILSTSNSIQEILGELKTQFFSKPTIKLRRENKIKTIHHSLAIEGNTLDEQQITALVEGKRVVGPKKEIQEVQNAIILYDKIESFNPLKEKDLLRAHGQLLTNLIEKPGQYRSGAVGVFKGSTVTHMAPPAKQVPRLMGELFEFIKSNGEINWLIKACIFHYELEFIHPFIDGNGRIGRLWQQLLLMKHSPVFEFIAVETMIHKKQNQYYKVLENCDKKGASTEFIEFSLVIILDSLQLFGSSYRHQKPTSSNRIATALEHFKNKSFTRKDYLHLYKNISTATASRDLAQATKKGILLRDGDKANAIYKSNSHDKKP